MTPTGRVCTVESPRPWRPTNRRNEPNPRDGRRADTRRGNHFRPKFSITLMVSGKCSWMLNNRRLGLSWLRRHCGQVVLVVLWEMLSVSLKCRHASLSGIAPGGLRLPILSVKLFKHIPVTAGKSSVGEDSRSMGLLVDMLFSRSCAAVESIYRVNTMHCKLFCHHSRRRRH